MKYSVTRLLIAFVTVILAVLIASFALANSSAKTVQEIPLLSQTKTLALGQGVYTSYCTECHGENGKGIDGRYPPLKTHIAYVYTKTDTMDYLIQMLLYGLEGEIEALITPKDFQGSEGEFATFNDNHPTFEQLPDEAIAAVLDYVFQAWDNTEYFSIQPTVSIEEVSAQRGLELTPQDIWALRKKLSR